MGIWGLNLKGMIFTELVGFLEVTGGDVFADQVIGQAELPNDGAFTSVGNYPSAWAMSLVEAASAITGVPASTLCENYGHYLFARLQALFPQIVAHYGTSDDMLSHVASHIHHEVRILYPDAQPPMIETVADGTALRVRYESHRPFAHIAFGLIRACLEHFGDPRTVSWERSGTPYAAWFRVAPGDPP